MRKQKVSIIGVGYVGLTLAAILSDKGFEVTGIDTNKGLIKRLKKCKPHFYERGLPMLMRKNIEQTLFFSEKIPPKQEVYILCVGTPVQKENQKPDVSYLENSAKQITDKISDDNLVILRSTVPIGSTRNLIKPILDKSGKKYFLAFCPERTVEGKALEELVSLPQIIGGINEESVEKALDFFKKVTNTTVTTSSIEVAEITKLLCNSFRDTFLSYGNEVAFICEALSKIHGVELDPIEVINSANSGYERSQIAKPGFVGGSCLEKDPLILANSLKETDYEPQIISIGRKINKNLIDHISNKIIKFVKPSEKIFVSGVAFKGHPETDDMRDSPQIELIEKLKEKGYYNIHVHDFIAKVDLLKHNGFYPASLEEGFKDACCVLIGNNNPKYNYLEIDKYISKMAEKSILFDIWRVFDKKMIEKNGVAYASIGK